MTDVDQIEELCLAIVSTSRAGNELFDECLTEIDWRESELRLNRPMDHLPLPFPGPTFRLPESHAGIRAGQPRDSRRRQQPRAGLWRSRRRASVHRPCRGRLSSRHRRPLLYRLRRILGTDDPGPRAPLGKRGCREPHSTSARASGPRQSGKSRSPRPSPAQSRRSRKCGSSLRAPRRRCRRCGSRAESPAGRRSSR